MELIQNILVLQRAPLTTKAMALWIICSGRSPRYWEDGCSRTSGVYWHLSN